MGNTTRLFVYLPNDLHRQMRVAAVGSGTTNGQVVIEALEKHLKFESVDKLTMTEEEKEVETTEENNDTLTVEGQNAEERKQ